MTTITSSMVIARPVAEVFAFIANYENDARWRAGVTMVPTPAGPARVGTTTREVVRFMGSDTVTTAEVVACEPGRRIAFRSLDGPYPVHGHREVAPTDGGTALTYAITIELRGIYKIFSPILVPIFRQRFNADVRRLKQVLEYPAHAIA